MDEILGVFIEDSHDLLAILESGLLRMDEGERDKEVLNAVFRAVHTLKGDAGIVELHQLEQFAHALETPLDCLRSGELTVGADLISVLLEACDYIRQVIGRVARGEPESDASLQADVSSLLARLRNAVVTADSRVDGLVSQPASRSGETGSLPQGDALLERRTVTEPGTNAAIEQKSGISRKLVAEVRQLRVSSDKLDMLVDMVGELVISSASASVQAKYSGQSGLIEANAAVSCLVDGIRELSLKLRMVPIGEIFSRLQRLVRDLAREMNREVDFIVGGEDTELDKAVVEKIGDPLMHLIRNAIDHGLEPVAERLAQGKQAKGRIELNAYHEGGGIVVEVADNGAGLNRELIRAKAIERGLIGTGEMLTDSETVNLIFEPGFSTAERITNVSGRGVGMDVVRSTIRALSGTIEVQSEFGQGSRFIMRLPLTMAIVDGFLIGVGNSHYVIPLDLVVECTDLIDGHSASDVYNLRGEALPCIRLREVFAIDGVRPRRENLVVIRHGERKACLVVDVLHGECQSVIKPLSPVFKKLNVIAGTTILGVGEVAFILDINCLLELAENSGQN